MWRYWCRCPFFWSLDDHGLWWRYLSGKIAFVIQLEFLFRRKKEPVRVLSALRGRDDVCTEECVDALRNLGLDALAQKVVVVWNTRMRTTAGRAFWPEGKIELNPKLKEIAPGEVRGTLLHELAHLVAYARAGRRRIAAHGAEWRQACADLGIPGERATHSLPLPGRTMQKKWRYACPACGQGFDRARKMKRSAGCYSCCKEHNGGYYHKKFRLSETQLAGD
jgi:SprT protein